jgi:addiction module HigA family antidote
MPTLIPIGPAANTPGEILRTEFLEPLGLSQNELATRSGLDRMRISEIVRGRRRLTAETAIAFAKVFEIEPQFWMNLQRDYDLAIEAKKGGALVRAAGKLVDLRQALAQAAAKVHRVPAIAHKRKAKATGGLARKGPSSFPESWAKPAGPKRVAKRSRK